MKYIYEIAQINIVIDVPFDVHIEDQSIPFIKKAVDRIDLHIIYKPVKNMDILETNGQWLIGNYYVENKDETRVYYCTEQGGKPYACMVQKRAKSEEKICYFNPEFERKMNYSRNFINMIGLESILCQFGGILLHSSIVRYENMGIVFSAPSGTGKSTQADLWEKYEQADILNGDRSCIRKIDGQWKVFGLPYAGSSGIYKNESANLKAVVVLRQAAENHIERLSPIEALNGLYAECSIHRWDPMFIDQIFKYLKDLITTCPVYKLSCRPDQEAVNLLKNTLFNE